MADFDADILQEDDITHMFKFLIDMVIKLENRLKLC